ncbi:MAG: hypothetical protein ACTH1W_05375, partial [Advenella sp.]
MSQDLATPAASGASPLPHNNGYTDLTVPSGAQLLHGVVLRPPNWAQGIQTNHVAQLQSLDSERAARVPGVVRCVARGSFVGVVAAQRAQAQQACALLDASWLTPLASGAQLQTT